MAESNGSLYRLVYLSENGLSKDPAVAKAALSQILASARVHNGKTGVTGALMFNAAYFAQVLEGPLATLEATFERIQCDQRHHTVVILAFEPCKDRRFAAWSMAYVGGDSNASKEFDGLTSVTDFDPARLSGDRVTELVQQHLLATSNNP